MADLRVRSHHRLFDSESRQQLDESFDVVDGGCCFCSEATWCVQGGPSPRIVGLGWVGLTMIYQVSKQYWTLEMELTCMLFGRCIANFTVRHLLNRILDCSISVLTRYDVPLSCPAPQPLLPTSHQPKQNQVEQQKSKSTHPSYPSRWTTLYCVG